MLKLAGYDWESFADADGVSCVLFFSGCHHMCEGCHSPQTHDFSYGLEITDEVIEKHADIIFEQAQNRMHAQKAIMAAIIG